MNKPLAFLLTLFISISSTFAIANADIPEHMIIKSVNQDSLEILQIPSETKTKSEEIKLGTVSKKRMTRGMIYELLDPSNNKLATASCRLNEKDQIDCSFDDNQNTPIGLMSVKKTVMDNQSKSWTFEKTIFAQDKSTPLITLKTQMIRNEHRRQIPPAPLYRTEATLYDAATQQEIGTYFLSDIDKTLTFHLKNRSLLIQTGVDYRVMMLALTVGL